MRKEKTMEHAHLFGAIEFAALLAGLNAKSIEGFDLGCEDAGTDAVAHALHGLVEKGVLTMAHPSGSYQLDEAVKAQLLCCVRAQWILRVLPDGGQTPCCIYLARDGAAAVTPLETMENGYRIESLAPGRIVRFLQERDYLPHTAKEAPAWKAEENGAPRTLLALEMTGGAEGYPVRRLRVERGPEGLFIATDAGGGARPPYRSKLISAWIAESYGGIQ